MQQSISIQASENVSSVKSVWSEDEANQLLSTGEWRLLHGGIAHKDGLGYQAKPVYVLGCINGGHKKE